MRDGLDEVVLRAVAPVPALLLLADMYAPGWKVYVDGQQRPLLRADLCLRAVALSAGEHEVRFLYRDPAVRRGLMISLAGLAGIAVLFLWPVWARRRGQGSATVAEDGPDEPQSEQGSA